MRYINSQYQKQLGDLFRKVVQIRFILDLDQILYELSDAYSGCELDHAVDSA